MPKKPTGWRNEHRRHALAARGVKTATRSNAKLERYESRPQLDRAMRSAVAERRMDEVVEEYCDWAEYMERNGEDYDFDQYFNDGPSGQIKVAVLDPVDKTDKEYDFYEFFSTFKEDVPEARKKRIYDQWREKFGPKSEAFITTIEDWSV